MDRTFHIVNEDERQIEDERIREHEALPLPSDLGTGCCRMCGRPTGVIELEDGTQVLGCRCMATREQLIAEIERLDTKSAGLTIAVSDLGKRRDVLSALCVKLTNSLDDLQSGLDQNEARVINARNLIDLAISVTAQ